MQIAFRSGHADRGLLINDRPVLQPVAWVSGRVADFYVWGNVPLHETTDGSRPHILEMELKHAQQWRNFTIAPAIRMWFYRDPPSTYSERSIEGWLYLSYDAGPFGLFSEHSLDVLTYRGGYFGAGGIWSERSLSPSVEVGGSFGAGWASSAFNDGWFGLDRAALNRISVEGWLTAYVNAHFYIAPHVQFSTTVDQGLRAQLARPTFFLVRLATGVEF